MSKVKTGLLSFSFPSSYSISLLSSASQKVFRGSRRETRSSQDRLQLHDLYKLPHSPYNRCLRDKRSVRINSKSRLVLNNAATKVASVQILSQNFMKETVMHGQYVNNTRIPSQMFVKITVKAQRETLHSTSDKCGTSHSHSYNHPWNHQLHAEGKQHSLPHAQRSSSQSSKFCSRTKNNGHTHLQ